MGETRGANGEAAENTAGHGFGTAPVFLASIRTILGAVLFPGSGSSRTGWGAPTSRIMVLIHTMIRAGRGGRDDLGTLFFGAMTRMTRYFQIRLQRRSQRWRSGEWRPAPIMVNARTFDHSAPPSAADLVLFGFTSRRLIENGPDLFARHPKPNDALFVSARQQRLIE